MKIGRLKLEASALRAALPVLFLTLAITAAARQTSYEEQIRIPQSGQLFERKMAAAQQGPEQSNTQPLSAGETVARQIKGGEIHRYTVQRKQGQVLRVDLTEKGLDVRLLLVRTEDQRLVTQSDFGFGYGRETLTAVAENSAVYTLLVGAPPSELSGSYELLVHTKDVATNEDKERIEAGSLLAEGLESHRKKETRDAAAKLEESLKIWKQLGDTYWKGYTDNLLGRVYMELGDMQRALNHYVQALPLLRASGDKSAEAQALNNVGRLYDQIGDRGRALEHYQRALALFRASGDKVGEAATLNNVGWLYAESGERRQALAYFDQALLLRRTAGDKTGEVATLNNAGRVYDAIGESRTALDFFNRALSLSQAVGNRSAESAVLNNIGSTYLRLGEKSRSVDYFSRALVLSRAVGDKGAEAQTLCNLAAVHSDLGKKQEVLAHYLEALPLFRAVSDQAGEATALNNLGSVYSDLGNSQRALEHYERALPLFRAISDKVGEAATLNNIGRLYADSGDQQALDYFNQALSLRRAVGDKSGEAQTLNNAGQVHNAIGEPRFALDFFNRALLLSRVIGDKSGEAQTLKNIASVWELLKNRRMSIFYFKVLVNKYQELRGATDGLDIETRKSFLHSVQNAYQKLAELLIEEGELEQAVEVVILYQDQQFFDFQNDTTAPVRFVALSPREESIARLYDTELSNVRQISSQIEELRRQSNGQPGVPEAEQWKKLEAAFKTSSDSFLAVAQTAEERFSKSPDSTDGIPAALTVTEMQAALRRLCATTNQQPVILYTLIGARDFHVLLISPDSVKQFSSRVEATDLNQKLLQLQAVLQSPAQDPRPIGRQLYDIIFKPVEPELKKTGANILMWSLEGNLRHVPLAALWDGRKYLIESYQNVYFTRADTAQMTHDVSRKWTGVAFGTSRPQTVEIADSKVVLPGLPDVSRELSAIFKPQPGRTTSIMGKTFIDKRFTEETFYRELRKRPSLVHISSHFTFQPGDDTRSFLLLGDGGTLTWNEMQKQTRLFEGVELLTLSACSTAANLQDATGDVDEFAELAQRLGADAVVSTLWHSSDAATSRLMRKLYAMLNGSGEMTKAEALRQAQLGLLNGTAADKPFAHPHYWAPFILIGNWK